MGRDVQEIYKDLLEKAKEAIENRKIQNSNGDQYNFFDVLGIQNREIYHSRFLKDLLCPKGLHGQGDLFLGLFFEKFSICKPSNLKNAVVTVEEVTKHGNLDISIKCDGCYIVIENKIWAWDQDRQLCRYSKTSHNGSKPILIYLTPNGSKPSDYSTGDMEPRDKSKIKCASYKKHITEWLTECIDKLNEKNIHQVSHLIRQYIRAIDNFGKDNTMDIDIQDDEIGAMLEVKKALDNALKRKRNVVLSEILNKIQEEMANYKFDDSVNLGTIDDGDKRYLFFALNEISYGVGVDSYGIYVGYYRKGTDYEESEIHKLISQKPFNKGRYDYLSKKANLNTETTLRNIAEDTNIDKIAEETVKSFCDIMAKHLQ